MTQFVFRYSNYNKNKEHLLIYHYGSIKKLLIFPKII
jgi:hypothetical protein